MALVGWSKTLGNSKQKLEEKTKELEGLTTLNNAANNEVIKKIKADINSLLFQDELFWRQRSRAIWLPAWDKNTKFFHQRASQRRHKNHIAGFLDNHGLWSTSEEATARVAENYFKDLFTSSNPRNMGPVLDVVDRVVIPEMNSTLLQPYTEKEVRQALFHMHPSKSLGPMVFLISFFKNTGILLERMLLM